ncbi:hypothetical protein [Leeuwenhoekiella nanhaiensis]|uniref:YhhN-like protein n=1 Tax=Leeuwenhoekiella nanhaiensis TaxID=1655491 RepID=A0A2G1VXD1_9FLAO|nr:hypothetical protein [Leeuwenhoekiella nanhaiensis]PHQ31270.1 hypothetical protein CJ305_03385 [Leeuwenhoekiella nanhaiensis]
MKGISIKNSERFKTLAGICAVLILINVLAVFFFSAYLSRTVRFVGSTILISYFLVVFPQQRNKVLLVLGAFWLRDIAAIFYEEDSNTLGYFIFGAIAYLGMFFRQLKSLLRFKIITPSITITGVVVLACFGLLYSLESILDEGEYEHSLIYYYYFLGISIVFSILLAIYYYYRIGGLRALLFSFAVFSFTISDIAAYLGIYQENYSFFLVTRIFYFAGLLMLMNFSLSQDADRDESLPE